MSVSVVIPKEIQAIVEASAKAVSLYFLRKEFARERLLAMRPYMAQIAERSRSLEKALEANDIQAYKTVLNEIKVIKERMIQDENYKKSTERFAKANALFRETMEKELPKALKEANVVPPVIQI